MGVDPLSHFGLLYMKTLGQVCWQAWVCEAERVLHLIFDPGIPVQVMTCGFAVSLFAQRAQARRK